MMLILLLIGVSAGMVLLAFPASRDDSAAQIAGALSGAAGFVRERGQQTGQLFGASVHPDRWQFMACSPAKDRRPRPATTGTAIAGCRCAPDASPPRAASPGTRCARFSAGRGLDAGRQPDVLIFPGGEVTPFQLRIGEGRVSRRCPRRKPARTAGAP
jgi:general secretion pathway protein H